MSAEDEIDMTGPDGASQLDRSFRPPRFSWTPAYEATFFRSLCESVQLGLRENNSFKVEAWERAYVALQEHHTAYPTKSNMINKSDNARKRFRLWRGLRENPEFTYDPLTKTVNASEEAWQTHVEKEPLARAMRGRPFEHEEYMEILYPDVIGSGGAPKRVMKTRRRTDGQGDAGEMPGIGILHLQSGDPQPTPSSIDDTTRPSLSETPTGSSNTSITQQILPPSMLASRTIGGDSVSALTPPDETVPSSTRKRTLTSTMGQPMFVANSPTSAMGTPQHITSSPDKRRRISRGGATINGNATPSLSAMPSTGIPADPTLQPAMATESPWFDNVSLLGELVEALKAKHTPRWRENAMDLFFRDFSNETLDLQVRICENVLINENKAMVFCKMPPPVRQHWVARLRDMHHKTA